MRNVLLIFILLLCLGAVSCEKESESGPQIPLSETIAGDWLVVYKRHKNNNFIFEDPAKGVVTEWDCFYVLSLQINRDNTYYINDSYEQVTSNGQRHPVGGKWMLDSHNNITFHCGDAATTSFSAYLNKAGQLVFENSELLIRHNRKP
ncbi:hypothetical protein D770_04615 [Flammeovirgaceae bacterium 311]|nr:hypothetical protein D770_04615 [Flammeovirgaceae bacterium 311]